MEKLIIENNKLIAEFIGYPTKILAGKITNDLALSLGYHKDYNALMSIVEYIEHDLPYDFYYKTNHCYASISGVDGVISQATINSSGRIEATYQAVVGFIKWYNENK